MKQLKVLPPLEKSLMYYVQSSPHLWTFMHAVVHKDLDNRAQEFLATNVTRHPELFLYDNDVLIKHVQSQCPHVVSTVPEMLLRIAYDKGLFFEPLTEKVQKKLYGAWFARVQEILQAYDPGGTKKAPCLHLYPTLFDNDTLANQFRVFKSYAELHHERLTPSHAAATPNAHMKLIKDAIFRALNLTTTLQGSCDGVYLQEFYKVTETYTNTRADPYQKTSRKVPQVSRTTYDVQKCNLSSTHDVDDLPGNKKKVLFYGYNNILFDASKPLKYEYVETKKHVILSQAIDTGMTLTHILFPQADMNDTSKEIKCLIKYTYKGVNFEDDKNFIFIRVHEALETLEGKSFNPMYKKMGPVRIEDPTDKDAMLLNLQEAMFNGEDSNGTNAATTPGAVWWSTVPPTIMGVPLEGSPAEHVHVAQWLYDDVVFADARLRDEEYSTENSCHKREAYVQAQQDALKNLDPDPWVLLSTYMDALLFLFCPHYLFLVMHPFDHENRRQSVEKIEKEIKKRQGKLEKKIFQALKKKQDKQFKEIKTTIQSATNTLKKTIEKNVGKEAYDARKKLEKSIAKGIDVTINTQYVSDAMVTKAKKKAKRILTNAGGNDQSIEYKNAKLQVADLEKRRKKSESEDANFEKTLVTWEKKRKEEAEKTGLMKGAMERSVERQAEALRKQRKKALEQATQRQMQEPNMPLFQDSGFPDLEVPIPLIDPKHIDMRVFTGVGVVGAAVAAGMAGGPAAGLTVLSKGASLALKGADTLAKGTQSVAQTASAMAQTASAVAAWTMPFAPYAISAVGWGGKKILGRLQMNIAAYKAKAQAEKNYQDKYGMTKKDHNIVWLKWQHVTKSLNVKDKDPLFDPSWEFYTLTEEGLNDLCKQLFPNEASKEKDDGRDKKYATYLRGIYGHLQVLKKVRVWGDGRDRTFKRFLVEYERLVMGNMERQMKQRCLLQMLMDLIHHYDSFDTFEHDMYTRMGEPSSHHFNVNNSFQNQLYACLHEEKSDEKAARRMQSILCARARILMDCIKRLTMQEIVRRRTSMYTQGQSPRVYDVMLRLFTTQANDILRTSFNTERDVVRVEPPEKLPTPVTVGGVDFEVARSFADRVVTMDGPTLCMTQHVASVSRAAAAAMGPSIFIHHRDKILDTRAFQGLRHVPESDQTLFLDALRASSSYVGGPRAFEAFMPNLGDFKTVDKAFGQSVYASYHATIPKHMRRSVFRTLRVAQPEAGAFAIYHNAVAYLKKKNTEKSTSDQWSRANNASADYDNLFRVYQLMVQYYTKPDVLKNDFKTRLGLHTMEAQMRIYATDTDQLDVNTRWRQLVGV